MVLTKRAASVNTLRWEEIEEVENEDKRHEWVTPSDRNKELNRAKQE